MLAFRRAPLRNRRRFNVCNLALPGMKFYEDQIPYSSEDYDVKITWIAEQLDRPPDVDRVHAVQLDRADRLALVEGEHVEALLIAFDDAARGDHLADVQPGALLRAQPPVRRVGDPRHRREHHRRINLERPDPQRTPRLDSGHVTHCAR